MAVENTCPAQNGGTWWVVDGEDLKDLRSLVADARGGTLGLPTLLQATQTAYQCDAACNAMALQTVAVNAWNQTNYSKLQQFPFLLSQVVGCKSNDTSPAYRQQACVATLGKASPDIYDNLVNDLGSFFDTNSSATSIAVLVQDIHMPGCDFATLHKGVVTSVTLEPRCK